MRGIQKLYKLAQFRVVGSCCRRGQHTLSRKDGWESVIGLEVHAQIAVASKIFSSAPVSSVGAVNTLVALLDASIPGTLPVLNKAAVEAGVLTAMALSCQINPVSTFDRKHYFYADSPTGYQITQQRNPLANNGHLDFPVNYDGVPAFHRTCRIHQLQLEQDSGKSLHDADLQRSLIDLNRAGVGLMEIVFEPDLKDGEEAAFLIKELILILETLETCNGRMQEGGLRVDANISVNRIGEPLGTRTEVKNISSIRSVVNAIEYEVARQIEVLESGGTIYNETRSFDAETKQTLPMRDKEMKQDYRFMPEPNLPPIRLSNNPEDETNNSIVSIPALKKRMKELPDETRKILVNKYGVRLDIAMVVLNTDGCWQYFNKVMKFKADESGKAVVNYLIHSFLHALYTEKIDFTKCPADPKEVAEAVTAIEDNRINPPSAIALSKLLITNVGKSCEQLIKEESLEQISDDDVIEKIAIEIMEQNPKPVRQLRTSDNPKKLARLFKQLRNGIAKAGDDKLNMRTATKILSRLIEEGKEK